MMRLDNTEESSHKEPFATKTRKHEMINLWPLSILYSNPQGRNLQRKRFHTEKQSNGDERKRDSTGAAQVGLPCRPTRRIVVTRVGLPDRPLFVFVAPFLLSNRSLPSLRDLR